MKRTLSLLLVLVLALSLCACGQSEEAKAADAAIAEIGTVDTGSKDAIDKAQAAVDALTDEDRDTLKNLDALEQAKTDYQDALDAAAAAEADALIDAIGTVDTKSGDAIDKARAAFDALTDAQKARCEKEAVLTQAETDYTDALVKKVEKAIDAIGDVTEKSKKAIEKAQTAYDDAPADVRELVSNKDKLTKATKTYQKLMLTKAKDYLKKFKPDEDRINGNYFYYPSGWSFYSDGSWAADKRCFVLPYLGLDSNNNVWIRLIFNYTGSDWVFFKNVITVADGSRHTFSFRYFDIVHDNSGGRVWEYIDTDVSESELDTLRTIADSKETLVRYEGDNYSHDITLSATDKAALRDTIKAYDLFVAAGYKG